MQSFAAATACRCVALEADLGMAAHLKVRVALAAAVTQADVRLIPEITPGTIGCAVDHGNPVGAVLLCQFLRVVALHCLSKTTQSVGALRSLTHAAGMS
jgi:hypothetical protein